MRVRFTEDADEQLERLPKRLQIRIVEKIDHYAQQPDPLAFAERLTGSPNYRFRIGDYRVIFEVLHDIVWILAIKRRDDAYR
jgi:mRNA interferase RelE/StbE